MISKNNPNKNKPWNIQKINDRMNLNMPSTNKIINLIANIEDERERTLVGLVYLTGGRISELIRSSRYKRDLESIRRNQIEIEEYDNHKILKITIRTLKKREDKKDTSFRVIPIPLDIEFNLKVINLIWDYIKRLEPEEELFPFKYSYAYRIIRENTGWNCHWIRHIRTYHLLSHFRFKEEVVRVHMGWDDLRPLSRYSSLKWMDIVGEYYK